MNLLANIQTYVYSGFAIIALVIVLIVVFVKKYKAKRQSKANHKELNTLYYCSDFDTVQPHGKSPIRISGSTHECYKIVVKEQKAAEKEKEELNLFYENKKTLMESLYREYEALLKAELSAKYPNSVNWNSLTDLIKDVWCRCPRCGGLLFPKLHGRICRGGSLKMEIPRSYTVDTGYRLTDNLGRNYSITEKRSSCLDSQTVVADAIPDPFSTTTYDCPFCKITVITEKTFVMKYSVIWTDNHAVPETHTDGVYPPDKVFDKFIEPWYTPKLQQELPAELFNFIDRPFTFKEGNLLREK